MFIHPLPVAASWRTSARRRSGNQIRGGRNETVYVPFVGGNGGNGPCFSRVNVL